MKTFKDAVAVITGAGRGIGRATAITFARLGARLVLADIDEAQSEKVAGEILAEGGNAKAYSLDVSSRESVEAFSRRVLDEFGNVDVVVNNAGVLILGEIRLTSLEDLDWIMRVNFRGVVNMTHFFLPPMIHRRYGHFVNIASANGLAPLPYVGAYSASKSAMIFFSESLRMEAERFGIGVTAVCPGLTRTGIREEARCLTDSDATAEFLEDYCKRAERKAVDPFEIAERIPTAILKNRAVVRIGTETRILSWLYRFWPGFYRFVACKVMKRTF
ncbi:MAG: SDR family NAD(P)-dependent oxidoreductase [Candidatus Fermentibacteria bacterium]